MCLPLNNVLRMELVPCVLLLFDVYLLSYVVLMSAFQNLSAQQNPICIQKQPPSMNDQQLVGHQVRPSGFCCYLTPVSSAAAAGRLPAWGHKNQSLFG